MCLRKVSAWNVHSLQLSSATVVLLRDAQGNGLLAGYCGCCRLCVKFTVANGKVYVGTRGNNVGGSDASTSNPDELDISGLKPK